MLSLGNSSLLMSLRACRWTSARNAKDGDFGPVLLGFLNQLGNIFGSVGVGPALKIERDDGDFVDGRVVDVG